ncbi:MAG: hypothetical protein AB7I50_25105 [Vicinamibacterales bacterium]
MIQASEPFCVPSVDRRGELLHAIQHEYRYLPGLSLTEVQMCRLWDLDIQTCRELVQLLVADGVLARRRDGALVSPSRPGLVRSSSTE